MSISAKEHYVTLSFDYCPNPLRSTHLHPILKIHHNSCYRAFSRTRSNTLHRSYRNGHAHRLLDVLAITTTCSGFGVSDCLRPPLLSDFKVKQTSSYLFSLVLRSAYTNPSTHEIACRSIKGLGCTTGITTLDIRFTCDQRTSPGFDLPKTQTTSPTTTRFQRISPRWSPVWAPALRESWLVHCYLGELRHPRLRHAGETPPEGFAWRKTPTTVGASSARGSDQDLYG